MAVYRVPYVRAWDLSEFVTGEGWSSTSMTNRSATCLVRTPRVRYFPIWLAELNPVEQSSNQFIAWYGFRFFEEFPSVKRTISTGFATSNEPVTSVYIYPFNVENNFVIHSRIGGS